MARKRESHAPDPTPDKQLNGPSGWCMTNYHDGCKYQFDHGKCGCVCHTQTQKTQRAREKVAIVADSNDPRPWRNNE